MDSITFGNATLTRTGTIVTCSVNGEAVARVNLFDASDEVPLTLWMNDTKFEFTDEQTKAFLAGMPRPEPLAPVVEPVAEVAPEEVVEAPVAEEAAAPAPTSRRGRRRV